MKYKTNFLSKVIFRIDFDKAELGKLGSFAKDIEKDFPIIEEQKGESGVINFNFKTKEYKQEVSPLITWNLFNKDRTIKLQTQPTFLIIEFFKYKDSSELTPNMEIVSKFIKSFNIKTINRLGLRYINEIKIDDKKDLLDWSSYINGDLLGSISYSQKNKKALARAMGGVVFKEDFGNINFNYGLWNSAYPNIVTEKIFVLDIDAYSKFPIDTDGLNLEELVKEYNKAIENIFESSIEDGLREVLNK